MFLLLSELRQYIKNNLFEGRLEDVIKKYPNPEYTDVIKLISDADPSGNQKYLMWVMKQLDEKYKKQDDVELDQVIYLINKFHKSYQKLPKKDINQYKSLEELENILKEVPEISKRASKITSTADAPKVYEDNQYVIINPKTTQASCKYGAGTEWCIAATKSRNYFDEYSSSNVEFYFIIDKTADQQSENGKIAIAYGRDAASNIVGMEIYNAIDHHIQEKDLKEIYGSSYDKLMDAIKNHVGKEKYTLKYQEILNQFKDMSDAFVEGKIEFYEYRKSVTKKIREIRDKDYSIDIKLESIVNNTINSLSNARLFSWLQEYKENSNLLMYDVDFILEAAKNNKNFGPREVLLILEAIKQIDESFEEGFSYLNVLTKELIEPHIQNRDICKKYIELFENTLKTTKENIKLIKSILEHHPDLYTSGIIKILINKSSLLALPQKAIEELLQKEPRYEFILQMQASDNIDASDIKKISKLIIDGKLNEIFFDGIDSTVYQNKLETNTEGGLKLNVLFNREGFVISTTNNRMYDWMEMQDKDKYNFIFPDSADESEYINHALKLEKQFFDEYGISEISSSKSRYGYMNNLRKLQIPYESVLKLKF